MPTLTSVFTDIANSIRSKTGDTALITPVNMANAINNISSSSVDPAVLDYFMAFNNGANNAYLLVGNKVEDAYNSSTFNMPLRPNGIGAKFRAFNNLFQNCTIFNQPFITSPERTAYSNCITLTSNAEFYHCFYNCAQFNSMVYINMNDPYHFGDGYARNFSHFIDNCSNFNNRVDIRIKCTKLENYPTTSNSFLGTNVLGLITNCNNFNSRVTLLGTVYSNYVYSRPTTSQTYYNRRSVYSCDTIISNCPNFNNQLVVEKYIDGNVPISFSYTFSGCPNINGIALVCRQGITNGDYKYTYSGSSSRSYYYNNNRTSFYGMFRNHNNSLPVTCWIACDANLINNVYDTYFSGTNINLYGAYRLVDMNTTNNENLTWVNRGYVTHTNVTPGNDVTGLTITNSATNISFVFMERKNFDNNYQKLLYS